MDAMGERGERREDSPGQWIVEIERLAATMDTTGGAADLKLGQGAVDARANGARTESRDGQRARTWAAIKRGARHLWQDIAESFARIRS